MIIEIRGKYWLWLSRGAVIGYFVCHVETVTDVGGDFISDMTGLHYEWKDFVKY